MFNKLMGKSSIAEDNVKKDFKKLAGYVRHAKGQHRTINNFAADCRTDANYIQEVINAKIIDYPRIQFLKIISDNSEGRVSLKDLTLACGYSNYANDDMEQIKGIKIKRGDFYWADYGDKCIDSEYGNRRMVLIIQNDVGNLRSSTTISLPMTSRISKAKLPTHVEATAKECNIPQDSIISCEQVRCISKRRLIQNNGVLQKIAECPTYIMQKVEVALGRAEGTIGLHVSEKDAIEALMNLNKMSKINRYEKNYGVGRQVACAF